VVTSDRGLCGGYNANALRVGEQLFGHLREQGKTPVIYTVGRKAQNFYKFRGRDIARSWTGYSEQPTYANAVEIATALVDDFLVGSADEDDYPGKRHGVDELHIVYTEFKSLMTQLPVAKIIGPMEVEDRPRSEGLLPAYEFEPEAEALLDALLPKYINTRIYAALIDAAASESAARRRAMKAASDNAEELIQTYTRQMNSARQAAITQEISEIVGGANALAAAGSDV
jgi:F-type H+-transporting ATPase subunit gamma